MKMTKQVKLSKLPLTINELISKGYTITSTKKNGNYFKGEPLVITDGVLITEPYVMIEYVSTITHSEDYMSSIYGNDFDNWLNN